MPLKPGDIIEKVKQAPSFQQNTVEASYSGLEVTWRLSFNSIKQTEKDGQWHVMSRNPGSYPWVYFDIDIEQYPQFKIMHEDEELDVTGVIERVSGHDINLKDIKSVSFPKMEREITSSTSTGISASVLVIPWYQKPLGQILIGLVILIIGGGVLYYLGWN